MQKICPACDSTTGLEVIERPEEFEIKGEKITIQVKLYHCKECGRSFSNKELGDPFKKAYDEYRRQKGMVQPEQITQFRKKYDLSQKELSTLLGFGDVTLSRYENGSLQDQVHDNILKLAMEPQNLLKLVNQNHSYFTDQKYDSVVQQIMGELSLIEQIESVLTQKQPDEYNGGVQLDLQKLGEVIEFLCFNRDVFKTKLMKLLFYSDFIHFKTYGKSITGLRYVHLPYGPVPDNYELILGVILQRNQNIHLVPVDFEKFDGEIVRVDELEKFDFLSDSELAVLRQVSSKFEYYSSKDLSNLSHKEDAYMGTRHREPIPYEYANTLSLD